MAEFVEKAFLAEEIARVFNADGSIGHAEFRIGDSIVMAFDARPSWPETRAFLRLYLADGDAAYARALAAGATAVTEMTDLFFGDRVGRVQDPQGNIWWLQTRVEEVGLDEMQRRAVQRHHLDAMEYVQSSLDEAMTSRELRPRT